MPSFDTPNPITARLDLVSGDARIVAGERATTTVEVTATDASNDEDVKAAELTRVEYAGGELLVKTPKLRSWNPRSAGGSIQVVVELPAGSRVRGEGQLADYHCSGELGDCEIKTSLGDIAVERAARSTLRTGAGDIHLDHATGPTEITTGTGDVRAAALDEGAVIRNSNGATWVGVAAGDLRVRAANGRIAVDVAHGSVDAKSALGDLRVGDAARGSVALRTKTGDIEVGIREGSAAWLELNATAGRVHNSLTATERPDPAAETLEVRARTTVGDVVVRRP